MASINATDSAVLGSSDVRVTRLGLGGSALGALGSTSEAVDLIDRAWSLGVRYFDTAPVYGASEERIGIALEGIPRGQFVVSTKVGRLERAPSSETTHDYRSDSVLKSLERSLCRLRLDMVDAVFIHDPDDHWESAIRDAYPALERLRNEGVVRAIGVGMNQTRMLERFAVEGDFDAFLVAGRYTLLDQQALRKLLPICERKDISIVAGGVLNTGILASPGKGTYDHGEAPPSIAAKAAAIERTCEEFGVPVLAAALQFPLWHPTVAAILAGTGKATRLEEYPACIARSIPSALWTVLKSQGLVDSRAPTG